MPTENDDTTVILDDSPEIEVLESDEIQEADEEVSNTLNDVIARLGGDSGVDILLKVYKTDSATNKKQYCFDTTPEALPLEPRLQKTYGHGDFIIQVYAPNKDGSKSLRKNVHISIAESLVPIEQETTKENSSELMDMFSTMMQSQNEMMLNFMKEQALTQENLMLKMVIEKGNNKLEQPSMLEMLQLFNELQGGKNKKSPMEEIKELLAVTGDIKDFVSPDKDTSGFGALTHGLDSLVDLVKSGQGNPVQQPPQKPAQQSAQNTAQQPAQITDGETMNPIVKAQVRKQLQYLCQQAANNRNAITYADLALDQIPEQFYPQIMVLIGEKNDEAISNLRNIEPEVSNYYDWFCIFCDTVREALTPEPGDDTTLPPLTNDDDSPINDGEGLETRDSTKDADKGSLSFDTD